MSWIKARENILKAHGHPNFTDAPQNIAFTILGWLYDNNFEDAILKAVNCGYDTDCTAATLGAILGMISGPDGLPSKWVDPIGNRVVVSPSVNGFQAPSTLDELTKRTIRAGKQVLSYWNASIVVHPDLATDLRDGVATHGEDEVRELWNRDVRIDRRLLPHHSSRPLGLELLIDFGDDGPAIARGESKRLTLTIINHMFGAWDGTIKLIVPGGWNTDGTQNVGLLHGERATYAFDVRAAEDTVQATYELTAVIRRVHDDATWAERKESFVLLAAAEWTIWGPGSREGAMANFSGNRLEWEKALGENASGGGTYRADTMLRNPVKPNIRLAAATDGLVTVKLDGETVIDCTDPDLFMPAYHRVRASQRVELELPAGDHRLEVTARGDNAPPQVYILPVAVRETRQPGAHYYYTDILFCRI